MQNQRVQAATTRVVESCRRAERIADGMLEEMDDVTPIHGVPVELDDEDSAVIAVADAMTPPGAQSAAGPTQLPKRRMRTEPGIR